MRGSLGTTSFTRPLATLISRARQWPVESQQQARRNAMLAATAATQRRVEREDVADYLARRTSPAVSPAGEAASASLPVADQG